jgi:DNA-binding transcriptional ArsR family regulator
MIDGERVCDAISGMPPAGDIADGAERFALLGDPTRLAILLCIRAAGAISVTDLAVATGVNDTTVSQALRLMRLRGAVSAQRHGRVIEYSVDDPAVEALLAVLAPVAAGAARSAH